MTSPFDAGSGTCHRCEQPGHWANDDTCPLRRKAPSKAIHEARIDRFAERYSEFDITEWQKREFIKYENHLWYDGKVPSRIGGNT